MEPWFICLILVFNHLVRVRANVEGDALHSLKASLTDPNNVLQSWDPTLVNPCTWFHVTCNYDNSVIRVDLGNAQLSGTLVPQLGLLKNLQYLELYGNTISGIIPSQLGNLKNLVSLDLYLNSFTGPIPGTLGSLTNLRFLRLNNNSLSGEIPQSLAYISALQILDLSNNKLSGEVPSNGSFSLFTPSSFANNPHLCGPGTLKLCPGAPPFSPPPPFVSPAPPTYTGSSTSSTGAIAGGVAAGAALLFAVPAISFALWRRRKTQECFVDVPAEEDPEDHLGQIKRFSLRELQVATDGFSNKNILGRGGFGDVYKGRLADGSLVAVKRLVKTSRHGELEFQTEVETLSMAMHRNLLPLCGFCMTPTERLLVYPYMANGNLASCLRDHPDNAPPLDWPTRRRVALGSARGLSYLHEYSDPKIIHRDVKASNIMLDEEFEAVVGDFGLAKLVDYKDTHVTTARICGTLGYMAPEYLSSGMFSEKSDVFGYGIVLLELITGHMACHLAQLANEDDVMLLDWVKGLLKEEKLDMLVDPHLQKNCNGSEVESLIKLALLCTLDSPGERPKMSEVVRMLEGDGLAERWEESQKVEVVRHGYNLAQQYYPHWIVS